MGEPCDDLIGYINIEEEEDEEEDDDEWFLCVLKFIISLI